LGPSERKFLDIARAVEFLHTF